MENQDGQCICLFCHKTDSLYVINNSSILIGSSMVPYQDVIFEIFFSKTDDDVVNFICKRCKERLKEMYLFKMNAKTNLLPSVFEDLKEFLDSGIGKPEPTYKRTENHFVVSFEPEKDIEIEELEKMADESSQYVDDVSMAVEEDPEPYFEVETVNEESETGMTDSNEYEDLIQPENIKKEEAQIETNENTYVFEPKALSSLTKLQQQHLREENYTKLTCCDVGFKDSKCFERHTKAHENFDAIAPFLESFTCSNCRIMFSNSEDLESHEAQHEESSELEEIILIERQSAFDDHILKPIAKPTEVEPAEADDDDEELFLCGHCGKRLSELNLKVHLLFFHTHSVVCPHDKRCFDGIKQFRLFSDHIRNKHPELFDKNNLYTCRHCDMIFSSNFEKLTHMKKCDAKVFTCENHCNKRFATVWLLKNHMKFVYGENGFSCEICGKRCVSKSDLQIHCRSHTNERPYSCPICHKSFKTSANRSSHLDIHEREKRHECEVCGEKFQTRPILRKHKKKHDEKYRAECICKICDRNYISKPHLLRHLKSSHSAQAELTTDKMNLFFEEYHKALVAK